MDDALQNYQKIHITNGSTKSKKWMWLTILLFFIAGFEAVALFSIQKFAIEKKKKWFLLTALLYGLIVPFIFYQMLLYDYVGVVNFLWNIFSTIFGFLIGMLVFKEKVFPIQWVGVALGTVAVAFIIFGDKSRVK